MTRRIHACLSAGVAATTAAALICLPSEPTPPPASAAAAVETVSRPVQLTAAAQPLAVDELPTLLTGWLQQVILPGSGAAPIPPDPGPVVGATSLGNAVVNAWYWALPWIDYGVELADYVLGFIPFGYLIGDQISIVWFSFGRPVANSFVVDLLGPVLNDPLNPANYVDGLLTLGAVTVNSLINLGINEFNYFFGWLIPPLPPLPPFPFAAEETELATVTEVEAEQTGAELRIAVENEELEIAPPEQQAAEQPDEAGAAAELAPTGVTEPGTLEEPTDIEETVEEGDELKATTDTTGTVSAQGEIRGTGTGVGVTPADDPVTTDDGTEETETEETTVVDPPTSVNDAAESDEPSEQDASQTE